MSELTSVRVNKGRNRRNRRLARVWAMGRGGGDLNEVGPPVLLFRGDIPGEANEYGQDLVRPADGFSAVDDICTDCRAVWWRPLRQVVALCRTFPGYGVCPTDLSGRSQRHRSLPVGPSLEALSHGVPRTDSALDAVRCERSPRLAHLRRLRPGADPSGEKALRGRELRGGTLRNGLRARFDDKRSVPAGFPV